MTSVYGGGWQGGGWQGGGGHGGGWGWHGGGGHGGGWGGHGWSGGGYNHQQQLQSYASSSYPSYCYSWEGPWGSWAADDLVTTLLPPAACTDPEASCWTAFLGGPGRAKIVQEVCSSVR